MFNLYLCAVNANQILGAQGEKLIADYVEESGNRIIGRNWRTDFGEIDLIAESPQGLIIFIEVKTRSSLRFGQPLEAIHLQKALRLRKLALAWLGERGDYRQYRVDCAGVLLVRGERPVIDYRAGVL